MRVKATAKRRAKSEAELVDHTSKNLLRALKRDMLKKYGRIDYDKLRKDGYSQRLLAKLEQARFSLILSQTHKLEDRDVEQRRSFAAVGNILSSLLI